MIRKQRKGYRSIRELWIVSAGKQVRAEIQYSNRESLLRLFNKKCVQRIAITSVDIFPCKHGIRARHDAVRQFLFDDSRHINKTSSQSLGFAELKGKFHNRAPYKPFERNLTYHKKDAEVLMKRTVYGFCG